MLVKSLQLQYIKSNAIFGYNDINIITIYIL